MKAGDVPLLTFFEGKQQFQVPIYQRTYSWGHKQCAKLLEDIISVGEKNESYAHFIGSVVYFQPEITTSAGIPKKLIIDGQQRITTITLLLAAIRNFIKNNSDINLNETSAEEVQDLYLFNPHKNGEDKFKLLLTKKDKDSLIQVLDGVPASNNISKRIVENFQFFVEKIKSENVQVIYRGIQKLIIVDAALEYGKDNPQLIFESLNSTGLDLSQADLIRNFIIMGQKKEKQDRIYLQSWYPMEQLFGESISKMTDFFRDYLTIKTGKIPKYDRVYDSFKNYIYSLKELNVEKEAKDFFISAEYYTNFALGRETDSELKTIFEDLKHLKVDVSYPLILCLYIDYKDKTISKDHFIELLMLIESYVFRRAICEIPTNSMNKTFGVFYKNIRRNDYINSFKANFYLLGSYKRFPRDEEFINSLKKKNVYNFRSRSYLLGKIENFRRKEKVNIDNYTIEHIMPQTLTDEWKKELGKDWEKVFNQKLHTIGNLTLTGYNSEMSNKSFREKLEDPKGFRNSPFLLNESVRNKDKWDEDAINKREDFLLNRIVEIFPEFPVADSILTTYRKNVTEEDMDEYSIDQFEMPDDIYNLYQKLSQRILNLNSQVVEEVKKLYIAFKVETNFVDIVPQKKRLWLTINMDIDQVYDPKGLCEDIAGLGRWGNGNVRISVSKAADIDYAIEIVSQSLDAQLE